MRSTIYKQIIVAFLFVAVASGCASYERKVTPFKMPSAYPNNTEVSGVAIAAHSLHNEAEAKDAFGFDIIGAGVLPIQVVFDNRGTQSIAVVPSQTFLIDKENNLWPIIDSKLAYERISKKTELGQVAPQALKSGALAGMAGAAIGAAIGIVSGHSVVDAAAKGAAVGTALGLTKGGVEGLNDAGVRANIREDLRNRSLQNQAIKPGDISFGFIFFPAETKQPKELRLRLKEERTGQIFNLVLPL
ncbi:MAG: hypothetical protein U1C55_12330 [Smithellaceae bacterium]|nr:hypothetical protein [Smithellaceae bacterium]